jgi:hypothetical protein
VSTMFPWFEPTQQAQLAEYQRIDPARAELLRRFDAVYLFGTIGAEAIMRSDGSVLMSVETSPDEPLPPWRPATEQERNASFVIAKKRIPELETMLPVRPPRAESCRYCKGTGYLIQQVVCGNCGGLGWNAPAA